MGYVENDPALAQNHPAAADAGGPNHDNEEGITNQDMENEDDEAIEGSDEDDGEDNQDGDADEDPD